MDFTKGDFTTVPNKEALKGKSAPYRSLYLALCEYANKDGACWPSRATLAKIAGVGVKTVDRKLIEMERDGLIMKRSRQVEGENISNLYQLMIRKVGGSVTVTPPSVRQTPPQRHSDALTKPIELNSINPLLSAKPSNGGEYVFDYPRELFLLKTSNYKARKIIALYFHSKGWEFENKIQFDQAVKRELRPANSLKGYSGSQIQEAIDYCEKEYETWTLETVAKRIQDLVLLNKN